MTTPHDLRARLRAVLPTLSPAGRQIVAELERDPAAAAQLTVHQLAGRVDTSPSSVVRVARALGYEGYPQLRLALAALPVEPSLWVDADVDMTDDAGTVIRKLADFEARQLQETAELLDAGQLEAAARAITAARRVVVYGVGGSGIAARDLAGKLGRLGVLAQSHHDIDTALPDAALARPDDVAIGISHGGESAGTLAPLRLAAERGAVTVAVTGMPRSPLAETSTHVLLTAGREFGFRPAAMASRTGQLLAGDALFARVAQLLPGARDALRRTYDSLREGR
ncbi:MurR/RpiR family transcriptional regulator [Actinoplanes solisilvae]|uniref:MurR/RpiR family transcriptional regulator n=1 Tax=Actinoplanes solisilvae TaxID=2486853 RepID=UPI00196B24DB|nr:MurR/RpiR family transcriptional regulator [Actinoplanes solisilvae]